uniref:Uncharacterized protein n=1 Tax=Rhipicephalus zambeziensis TaxID=60191 RepID=A0A224YAZ1_9ACAR
MFVNTISELQQKTVQMGHDMVHVFGAPEWPGQRQSWGTALLSKGHFSLKTRQCATFHPVCFGLSVGLHLKQQVWCNLLVLPC